MLERIQNELFDVGADLSVPLDGADRLRIEQPAIDELERLRRRQTRGLSGAPQRPFRGTEPPRGRTSPGRCAAAPSGKRSSQTESLGSARSSSVYLNRLSDLLFILARAANGSGATSRSGSRAAGYAGTRTAARRQGGRRDRAGAGSMRQGHGRAGHEGTAPERRIVRDRDDPHGREDRVQVVQVVQAQPVDVEDDDADVRRIRGGEVKGVGGVARLQDANGPGQCQ